MRTLRLAATGPLSQSIDFLSAGTLLLHHPRQIAYVNLAGERILRTRDGLRRDADQLSAMDPAEDQSLVETIAQAFEPTPGFVSRSVAMSRPSGWQSYQLVVLPPRKPAGCWRYVTVFITDPARDLAGLEPRLRELYGLTPAESNVATLLARGYDVKQTAEERGVALETVRWLLKRVFEKTGTRRQVDLVRLILSSCVLD
jgi:DNA-binding CsgD family transcriptional regulator